MKISELIKKLEILKSKHGDNELRFTANDSFSIYGKELDFDLKVGDTNDLPSDWWGSVTNSDTNTTTLKFYIHVEDNKKSKIIFRQ